MFTVNSQKGLTLLASVTLKGNLFHSWARMKVKYFFIKFRLNIVARKLMPVHLRLYVVS